MGTLAAFAADLACRTDDDLLRLFLLRPDAITPPVANFADLASRLSTTDSINAALDQLSLPQLRALTQLAPDGACVRGPELGRLDELALVMRTDLAERSALLVPANPASPITVKHDADTPLFVPLTAVALALGDGAPDGGPADMNTLSSRLTQASPNSAAQTAFSAITVSPAMRDNAVGSAVEILLRTMTAWLQVAGDTGISALRAGSIGVRPMRELSKTLDIAAESVHFYLELAAAAGLLVLDEAARKWLAVDTSWTSLDRSGQWLVLVDSWLTSARPPAALIRPLAPYDPPRHARLWRRKVAAVMADLAANPAAPESPAPSPAPSAPDSPTLLHALRWRHPRQTAAMGHELPALLPELEWLGVTGAGMLSSAGRAAILNEHTMAAAALSALLPAEVEHFILQGDLTAIAPGFLIPEVASTLQLMSVAEGRGAAGIFRFSQRSLEAAANAGLSRSVILDFLRQHSSTAVPQPLLFLMAEVFRNDSEAQQSTPPVASSPIAARPESRQPPLQGNDVVRDGSQEQSQEQAQSQLERLRHQPVWSAEGVGESGPALVMEQLRQALGRGAAVRLRAVDGAGEVEEILVQPVSLLAGMLRASLATTGRERRISIHRIISAVPESTSTMTRREHHG